MRLPHRHKWEYRWESYPKKGDGIPTKRRSCVCGVIQEPFLAVGYDGLLERWRVVSKLPAAKTLIY